MKHLACRKLIDLKLDYVMNCISDIDIGLEEGDTKDMLANFLTSPFGPKESVAAMRCNQIINFNN